MTTYRLMDGLSGRPGNGPSTPAAYSGPYLAGTMFSPLGEMLWLNGYYWWVCNTGQSTAAQKFALWNRYSTSAENLVSAATVTSGTLTAGAWNYVPLATPVQLAPGALYVAATGWNTAGTTGFPVTNNQFGAAQPYASGITNGPLTAWSDTGGSNTWAGGTGANYNLEPGTIRHGGSDPTLIMPAGGSNSSNFWMDVLVSDQPPRRLRRVLPGVAQHDRRRELHPRHGEQLHPRHGIHPHPGVHHQQRLVLQPGDGDPAADRDRRVPGIRRIPRGSERLAVLVGGRGLRDGSARR